MRPLSLGRNCSREWRSRCQRPAESLVLASHDGYLVGLFPTGDGFMFRLDEEAGEFVRISQTGYCGFVFATDRRALHRNRLRHCAVRIRRGRDGARWWSKEFAAQNRPASAPLKSAVPGRSSCPFRATACRNPLLSTPRRAAQWSGLQAGWKAQRWMFMLTVPSTGYVTSVRIAETPQELAGV